MSTLRASALCMLYIHMFLALRLFSNGPTTAISMSDASHLVSTYMEYEPQWFRRDERGSSLSLSQLWSTEYGLRIGLFLQRNCNQYDKFSTTCLFLSQSLGIGMKAGVDHWAERSLSTLSGS
ncbi:hypothetical protein B0H34DRAFT_200479 [Crassisporium funariophilum]|nr:hypothetical protein B0H34DRAFT_200479 [Crassisporium funariophilum]